MLPKYATADVTLRVQKHTSTVIPVELCEHLLREKLTGSFQFYLLLKSYSDGVVTLTPTDKKWLAEQLKYDSVRSVVNNLNKLISLDFIGYDAHMKTMHLRGFGFMSRKLNLMSRTGAIFQFNDILKFRAFCTGAVISSIIKSRERASWLRGSKKRCPLQSGHLSYIPLDEHAISDSYLAEKLGVSDYAAHEWKKEAASAGFLSIIRNRMPLGVSGQEKGHFLRSYPELEKNLRYSKEGLWLQLADNIIPNVRFAYRKKK